MSTLRLEFHPGALNASAIQEIVLEVLSALSNAESEAYKAAVEAKLSPKEFADATVETGAKSKGFVITSILIAIGAPVAVNVINKLWDDVIWPRITDQGDDALGKPKQGED